MTEALSAGRRFGAPARRTSNDPRAIVATADGVYLWPGIALVCSQYGSVETVDSHQLGHLIGQFFGPQAALRPFMRMLSNAAHHLRRGASDKAQRAIDRAALPPISPNGRRLMRAIARRQGVPLPNFPVADIQSGTVWQDDFVAVLAKTYDDAREIAQRLAKSFEPGSASIEQVSAGVARPCSCGCAGATE